MPRQRIMNKALRPTVGPMKAEVAIDNNSRPRCQDSPDFHRCINSKAGRLCPDRQMVGKGEARRDTGLRQRVENDRPMIDIEAPLSVDMRSDGLRHLAVLRRKQCVGLQPSLVKADVVERQIRSEEHTSELQSLMRISYAVFCLKTKSTKR